MRLSEITQHLFEARSADLYHGTSLEYADQILASNRLNARSNIYHYGSMPTDKTYREKDPATNKYKNTYTEEIVSFSRDAKTALGFATGLGGGYKSEPGSTGRDAVIFVVDQNLLHRDLGKRMIPHDYSGSIIDPGDEEEVALKKSLHRSEQEEAVFGDINNFKKYIKQLILVNVDVTPEVMERFPHVFTFPNIKQVKK